MQERNSGLHLTAAATLIDMARVVRIGNQVKLSLSIWEQLGGLHLEPIMEISEITSIEYVNNPWNSKTMRGMRAPGTGFPYLIMLGTLRNFRGWKAFCAIYKRKPAVIINFKSGPFNSWIVTAEKSEVPDLAINRS